MKKTWKHWLSIAVLGLGLTACGSSETEPAPTDAPEETEGGGETAETDEALQFTIGATQIVEHPSLDAAFEGFQAALADAGLDVTYDFQSAQGDQNNTSAIANNFVADQVDLIFANSTPSALGALQATNDIPILFTSVTDAVGAGLVEAMDQPGENITGVLDLHPDAIQNTVDFIDQYFADATVGLIYNAGEPNSVAQIEAVQAAAEGTSLSLVTRTVATSAEVQQAAASLVSEVDLFYVVTDNTVVSALATVVGVANEQDIPLVVGEPDSLAGGGFATFGIDYHSIGYRTGEMAVEILTGEKATSEIPVEYPANMQLLINKEAAEEQGVEWNPEWDDIAEFYEAE
ncbi:ABC transporter substrate-binding protein [Alkalihalobacillus oceani]|uniref:ABC transporter substrate-binding protein n=1 Tax=Halalkalibacter oceani TaxID=1653776 RepID=UPI00203C8C18|nr:ABC transporter substrate-binding protein [Halalkalibacter oceani]MCM3762127.1 ABC transporter substrate-binding protein [Halalkalibacter oceani]